jgi:UDP-N-acetylglucosamine--N-acetylmuramyl-(pentapeptide) pyrophosphoryl-undecaprenol N-acetylglucosamine transferase
MNILIACGASGGHIFPGIALAQEILKDRANRVLIVCSDKPIDVEILKKSGCDFVTMPRNPFIRTYNPLILLLLYSRHGACAYRALYMNRIS